MNTKIRHISAGGMLGGNSVCGNLTGDVVMGADESNCISCILRVRDWVKTQHQHHTYTMEVKRACDNIGITF